MSPGALFGQSMLIWWKPFRARVECVVGTRSLSRRDVAPCSFRFYGEQRSLPASPPRRISGSRRPALPLPLALKVLKVDFRFSSHATNAHSRLAPQVVFCSESSPLRIGFPTYLVGGWRCSAPPSLPFREFKGHRPEQKRTPQESRVRIIITPCTNRTPQD